MSYRTVIGLEVHVQLLTRTKLFCGCRTDFGLPPNSATCPVCAGLPGVLPVMNAKAFDLSLRAALALNCQIAPFTKWDRKNYYYPDLPKNYQISQYDLPFSHDGYLEIETDAGPKRIRILRVHLEEDAGKMLHDEKHGKSDSLVDLNRTGTPLLEIVSEPDFSTGEEVRAYLEELRLLLRELGVSDCEMQEGSLRCDANVNIHVPQDDGSVIATPIIEIKNVNSIRGAERAVAYEVKRQHKEYEKKLGSEWHRIDRPDGMHRVGERQDGKLVPVAKATAGWDDAVGATDVQRRKEEASDYRYFPDPDLVPVTVGAARLEEVRAELGELPAVLRKRLQSQYGLSAYDAGVLTREGRAFATYFEEAALLSGDAKAASNWMTNQILQTLNERKETIREFSVPARGLGELIRQVRERSLNMQRAREVYAKMLETGAGAAAAIEDLGFDKAAVDAGQLRELVKKAVAGNPRAVADYKNGKVKAADAIKGAVMRETKGMANTEQLQQLLLEELQQA
jgi:aspartyl-tRNA(Asn)/glutamyl-tRNA(Gln) amidotransferase subunit B